MAGRQTTHLFTRVLKPSGVGKLEPLFVTDAHRLHARAAGASKAAAGAAEAAR